MSANGIDLVVFDMEGTLTASPTVWELMHGKVGTWTSHGLPYWEQYKAGALGYDEFARLDTATWKGAPVEWLDRAVEEVPLMEGCRELLAHLAARGIRTAIVSNGLERLGLRLTVIDDWRLSTDIDVPADLALVARVDPPGAKGPATAAGETRR